MGRGWARLPMHSIKPCTKPVAQNMCVSVPTPVLVILKPSPNLSTAIGLDATLASHRSKLKTHKEDPVAVSSDPPVRPLVSSSSETDAPPRGNRRHLRGGEGPCRGREPGPRRAPYGTLQRPRPHWSRQRSDSPARSRGINDRSGPGRSILQKDLFFFK